MWGPQNQTWHTSYVGEVPNGQGQGQAVIVIRGYGPPPVQQQQQQQTPVLQQESSSGSASFDFRLSNNGYMANEEHQTILTPSRLRTHSLSVTGYTCSHLMYGLFAIILQLKLGGIASDISWWLVFMPLFFSSLVHIPININLLLRVKEIMKVQVGPAPAATASVGLHLQYELIMAVRRKSHICDHAAVLIESCAHLLVKLLFAWALQTDRLGSLAFRVIIAPAWVGWAACVYLNYCKDRHDRGLFTFRDLFYIFTVMVALKVDGISSFSYKMAFALLWVYFTAVFVLGAILLGTLMLAQAWHRVTELLLPISFCGWLLSNIPLFAGATSLAQLLDEDETLTTMDVLAPVALAFLLMTICMGLLAYGLHLKESIREALVARGAVWTAHEGVARRMQGEREAAQQHVDSLPEEDLNQMMARMMSGKTKPLTLLRVGVTLYRRVDESSSTSKTELAVKEAQAVDDPPSASEMIPAVGQHPPGLVQGSGLGAAVDQSAAGLQHPLATPLLVASEASHQPLAEPSQATSVGSAFASAMPGASDAGVAHPTEAQLAVASSAQGSTTAVQVERGSSRHSMRRGTRPTTPILLAGQSGAAPGRGFAQGGVGALANSTLAGLLDGGLLGMGLQNQVVAEDADDSTCVICYDAKATCVFLDCGHGGFCVKCARLIFVRPPNECPACRQHLDQVVQLEEIVPINQIVRVKQTDLICRPECEQP